MVWALWAIVTTFLRVFNIQNLIRLGLWGIGFSVSTCARQWDTSARFGFTLFTRKLKAVHEIFSCINMLLLLSWGKLCQWISPMKTIPGPADAPLQSSDRHSYFSCGQRQVAPSLPEVFHYLFKADPGEQWMHWRGYLSLRRADKWTSCSTPSHTRWASILAHPSAFFHGRPPECAPFIFAVSARCWNCGA